MAETLIELREVDIYYGAVQALFGVSLHVIEGETVAVLGGNASGKSTTLKTVLGLVQPKRGEVLVAGKNIRGMTTSQVIALGLGSIPEGRRVFPEMTVKENLLMGAYLRRNIGRAALERECKEALALFPSLHERMNQLAGTLSGGEQQMLVMGRAWMRRPRLLCVDEPSMGLSPLYVERVYQAMHALKAQNVTILMVEQNATMALEVADRAYVLRSGAIVVEGPSAELASNPAIRRAYLGEQALI